MIVILGVGLYIAHIHVSPFSLHLSAHPLTFNNSGDSMKKQYKYVNEEYRKAYKKAEKKIIKEADNVKKK